MFHSVLLGACPRPCSKRADMLYYYFHIKEEHFKMFFLRQIYIRIFTKTHQIVPVFKNFLEGTCSLTGNLKALSLGLILTWTRFNVFHYIACCIIHLVILFNIFKLHSR